LGFRGKGLGFRGWSFGFRVQGLGGNDLEDVQKVVELPVRVSTAERRGNLRTTASQKCGVIPRRAIFKAHRLVYHSTLGLRVIKKKMGTT